MRRTRAQRESDRIYEYELYLQGFTAPEIRDILYKERGRRFTAVTIRNDIAAVRDALSDVIDIDDARKEWQDRIRLLMKTYWQVYENTGDIKGLNGVEWAIDRGIKLLGIDPPKRKQKAVSVGVVFEDKTGA